MNEIPLTTLPPEAAPVRGRPGCPSCKGQGYQIEPHGELARAARCACVPPCPRCEGRGVVAVLRDGVRLTGRCLCQQLPDRVERFNWAHIPARHARATLESFYAGALKQGDAEKAEALLSGVDPWLKGYQPGRARGLVLHGPVGRGKTHLMVGVLRRLVFEQGQAVRFIEFSRLLGQLKEAYSRGEGDSQVLGEVCEVPILGIDELGKGRLTDWELAIIDEIVSRRYNAMRCTLATTNYEPKPATGQREVNLAMSETTRQTLGDRVGDRVFSRLRETSAFVFVGGIDMRPVLNAG